MGGGDLNLKKSWHPSTYHNLKKVWEAEQQAAQEEQKLEQLRKEKAAERDVEELRRLQEVAGLVTRKPERVEWLYAGGGGGSGGTPTATTKAEEYLLGKRRFEPSLEKPSKDLAESDFKDASGRGPLSTSSSVNSNTEYEARLREDPLLAIKQKEVEFRKSLSSRSAASRTDSTTSRDYQGRRASYRDPAARRGSRSPPHTKNYNLDSNRTSPHRGNRGFQSRSRDFGKGRRD